MIIVQVRGTGGSGKTTLVRSLVDDARGGWEPDYGPALVRVVKERKKPIARGYRSDAWKLYVVGSYHCSCGGAEGLPMEEIEARATHWARKGYNVVFEGLFISCTTERFIEMSRSLRSEGIDYISATMSTPLAECYARIQKRRAENGTMRPFNPSHTEKNFNTVERVERNLQAASVPTIRLPFGVEVAALRELLDIPEATS